MGGVEEGEGREWVAEVGGNDVFVVRRESGFGYVPLLFCFLEK